MAQKVQVVLIDDFGSGDATETVTFGLDGATYEIDLNEENAAKLRDALALYVAHGRKVTGRGSRAVASSGTRARRRSSSGEDTAAIREWARSSGRQVSERGRISAAVREAYHRAH